jgi:hypothetical protein
VKGIASWRRPALVLALAALLAAALVGARLRRAAQPTLDLSGWDVPRLVEHLRGRGLPLRAVSTIKDGPIGNSAYLTTTDRSWRELNLLFAAPEQIDHWQGTLYCERVRPRGSRDEQAALWGDCCLLVEPFLFFGDRELLLKVREALRDGRG